MLLSIKSAMSLLIFASCLFVSSTYAECPPCVSDPQTGQLTCPMCANFSNDDVHVIVNPEPLSMLLLGGGLAGAAVLRKRKKI